ncbi:PKSKA1 [Xylaria arbuscula]|nr:PKSKA1 [Xylaria arbuscula]
MDSIAISLATSITSSCSSDDGVPQTARARSSGTSRNHERKQVPVAIVGMGCRLPGHSNSPTELWNFLKQGGIAVNEPPASRFSLAGHHDKHRRPRTMKSPGGMFMEDVEPEVFDAQFFNISRLDAIAMDPQQRQLLEVTYECLENAGVPLEAISGTSVGCLVGTNIVDYGAIQNRDPEDRPESATIGVASSILSNRISHFLNISGPSMTIDTACSASLVAVDVACRYLDSHQADGMLVAGANIWLSPEHNEETGMMRMTQSASGKCHSFDANADGYVKAEGINCVYLKRLDDAIRDGDPIRAVIRGTATNSAGRTPGLASPSPAAQAAAIRAAYKNAGIANYNDTAFLECHGTGTLAGDPIEVEGAASVFAKARDQDLIIGSIKSNIGHSEAAAGLSGLIKASLAVENALIPGNPTFVDPNPKIDFEGSRVRVTRVPIKWPVNPATPRDLRRASVNSFGFGGANAHAVVENYRAANHVTSYKQITADFFGDDVDDTYDLQSAPTVLAFSANDKASLTKYVSTLSSHLINPSVSIDVGDLAFTLSERRSKHYYRAFAITRASKSENIDLDQSSLIFGKKASETPRVGFVFTGQGAQWSQMGLDLVNTFPASRDFIASLDEVLHSLPNPPKWSLLAELTESRTGESLRQPEFSQPLVTALQLALVAILEAWEVRPTCVVGHSSGEIAAASAAGFITPGEAIKIAYYRGQAAKGVTNPEPLGMLAVGVGSEEVQKYMDPNENLQIACYNSPNSITISGTQRSLEALKDRLQADGHFARLLQVDLAYHSTYMEDIGAAYEQLLRENCNSLQKSWDGAITMFSTVTGQAVTDSPDTDYWRRNMVSPVKFAQATSYLLEHQKGADFLIELGPSGALSGPIAQIKKTLSGSGTDATYVSVLKRGANSSLPLYQAAGNLFLAGGTINLAKVNCSKRKSVIVDLPNYSWNHSTKYWHESQASKDWRFKKFINHDLLGSKMNGTSWHSPVFKKTLKLADLPWLADHKIGSSVVFPGAGYIAMAMEAMYQTSFMTSWREEEPQRYRYKLRDVKFSRALVLQEDSETRYTLALTPYRGGQGTVRSWYEFRISSLNDTIHSEHSTGLICIETDYKDAPVPEDATRPLELASSARTWYKAMADSGYNYGPTFRKHLMVETTMGKRQSRSTVDLVPPPSKYGQSTYPMHPTVIDACFHTGAPAVWKGDTPAAGVVLVPAVLGSLVIESRQDFPTEGTALASAFFLGVGDRGNPRNYGTNCSLYDPKTGALLFEMKGLTTGAIEAREDQGPGHGFTCVHWDADISMLLKSPETELLSYLEQKQDTAKLQVLLDLIAHKNPQLSVLELGLGLDDVSSEWIQDTANPTRAAVSRYHLAVQNPDMLVKAKEKLAISIPNAEFSLFDVSDSQPVGSPASADLAILRTSTNRAISHEALEVAIEKAMNSLCPDGIIVTVGPGLNSGLLKEARRVGENVSIYLRTDAGSSDGMSKRPSIVSLGLIDGSNLASESITIRDQILQSLEDRGWKVQKCKDALEDVADAQTVLVTDELFESVMERPNERQWAVLKHLVQMQCKVLWVTTGAQSDVKHPSRAAVQGFFRTIRAEEQLCLITLDVERPGLAANAISSCLDMIVDTEDREKLDTEFVERNGMLQIARVLPDAVLTTLQSDEVTDRKAEVVDLHENETTVRLGAERLGNVDSVHWAEIAPEPTPLPDGFIEVEVYAAGLNYKDVVVTMGIVPGDERMLGGEAAGIVTKVSPGVTSVEVGQRVVVFARGCFANRVQTTPARVHKIPDTMSFEEAATLCAVYLTSIYSFFDLANIEKGKKVLIHSAAGGVGIAAIQLAQYAGADTFVTVGTAEKKQFLQERFGIPDNRIFNSRNVDFADQIMAATDGQGVDIVLNSLTGDMLDESFRILADGGTMIEIGKKDILDRNSLSMEPFDRNISFRSVDMSHERAPDHLIARLIGKLFTLITAGHVKPIHPIHHFSFQDAPSAIRLLRAGKHIGKIVLSDGVSPRVQVSIRRAPKQLTWRDDAAYLIVGGLRGLCGSLAIYLAKCGAKRLAVVSRSGYNDDKSRGVVKQINALGANIDLLTADITNAEDLEATLTKASAPIAGIIQGAMVLRDRPFDSMTLKEYHEAVAPKIQGTWNLHNVALKLNFDLDFFSMLSSISGVTGTRGQANYSAANVFMDSFASYRQQQGLPANSIDLGVIEDSGFLADNDGFKEKHFDSRVYCGINDQLLRKILYLSILQQTEKTAVSPGSAAQMISGIIVPQPTDSLLARDPRFSALFTQTEGLHSGAQDGNRSGSSEVQALLLLLRAKSADHASRLAAMIKVVNNCFVRMLRLSEPMDPERPLAVYGIDSLAAVEVRNWVRTELGAQVTTLDIMNTPSMKAFCEKIISKIIGGEK